MTINKREFLMKYQWKILKIKMQIKKARVSVTHTRTTVKKRCYFMAAVDSRVINFASKITL
jgi:hypothetical protein